MIPGELGPLAPGARVALVAPSGPVEVELLERANDLLLGWGLVPIEYPGVRARHPRADYLAGSDEQRASDLQAAWCDPAIDAVFCVRGGYGSARILDLLDPHALAAASPKPLFGSSDITGIHEYWFEKLGRATWFTPMVATEDLLDDETALASLHRAVFEPHTGREFGSPEAVTLVAGTGSGVVVGGNLSLLAMTLGAKGRPAPANEGRIALLEDVTEAPYRLDGMLTSLLRAGWFDGVAGVALGSWHECGDLADVRALVEELLAPLGVPLVWELGFGHGPRAQSMPLGVPATLIADSRPRLVIPREAARS